MMNVGLLILRVVPAVLMMMHGWSKIAGFSEISSQFPDPVGVGSTFSLILTIFAEFFCPILLIAGLATRLAVIPLFITMMVAALIVHAQDPFMKQEFPILYAVIFLSLFFTGGGSYGLGNRFQSMWLKS